MEKFLVAALFLFSLVVSNVWAVEKTTESPLPVEALKLPDGKYVCRCPHFSTPKGIKMPAGDSSMYTQCLKDFQFAVENGGFKIGDYQGGEKPSTIGPVMISWFLAQPLDDEAEHAVSLTVTVARSFLKDSSGFFFVDDASGGAVTYNFLFCARQ